RRRGLSLPRRGGGRPGFGISLALLALLKGGAGGRKAQGFGRPLKRDTLWGGGPGSLAIGAPRLSALPHRFFVGPCPHTPRAALADPGYWLVHPGSPAGSQLTGRIVRKAGSEAPREPGRPAEPAGTAPASYQTRPTGRRPSDKQDERTNREQK